MAPEDATTALAHGEYRADVARRGAGLRLLERSGRALTETWPAGEKPPLSAGLVLAPWPNRTRDGEFAFGGTTHRLEITEAARNNASHGLVRRRDWDVVDRTDSSVTHAIEVGGEPGWPFPLRLTVRHALADDGLTVTHTATNLGDTEAPFGLGVHAFARAGDAPLDECTLHLSAGVRLPLDPERNLPAGGPVPVAGTDADFATPRRLAGVWLDTPFSALVPDADGRSRQYLMPPDGPATVVWTDAQFPWVQVFTADPAHDQAYPDRGRALAIEPMTCPPDALNSGVDLVVLTPGETWTGAWGLGVATDGAGSAS
ncbi:aldose 1-epimerase family protein [Rhodococcoides kroppenstedtii]|uniref:aldose 1-epimerase family protein n=1 Tax=Rhodococcoides kroppenstedtii TaxID=293050 RepID=UPI001427D0C2|nr:aldose 1-epimerase family protein [Rhodococcus kroppenstedtii]NIL81558.1 protein YihR [Rhodococcus kroppenstedtii]